MKVNFAIVLAIVVAMPSLIGLAPAAAGDVKEKAVKELLVLERVGMLAPRKWLDKTEKHETTAKYVGLSADGVRLQKTDGKIVTVPLDKLSDTDREYVHVKRCLEEEDERRVAAKKQDTTVEAELKKAAESLAAGQTDEAIARYHTALEIKPNGAEAHNGLGLAMVKNGRTDQAIEHFRMALMIKPDVAEAYNGMGAVLMKRGLVNQAIPQFQKALQIKPDFAEAKENLAKAQKAAQSRK